MGVQGLIVYLSMVALTLMTLYRVSRLATRTRDPLETKLMCYGCIVAFTTYQVTSLGTERLYCESFWWIFAMPHWLNRVVQREVRAEWPALAHEDAVYNEWEGYDPNAGQPFEPTAPYRPRPALP